MACGPEKFRYQDDLMLDESGEAHFNALNQHLSVFYFSHCN